MTRKTNSLLALYRHLAFLAGSILFSVVFGLLAEPEHFRSVAIFTFFLFFSQMELYYWIAIKFFSSKSVQSLTEFRKRAIYRLISFYLLILLIAAAIFIAGMAIVTILNGKDLATLMETLVKREAVHFALLFAAGALAGAILYFYYQWADALKREHQLQEQILVFRYETLKNQINPHFLFNSLNTLTALIHRNPSLAEEFVHKLSSIYRYVLENNEVSSVPLKKELAFVNDYFYLINAREEGKIVLEIQVPYETNFYILPMSLQILVENCMKHNIATAEQPLTIKISLKDDESIQVENNLQPRLLLEPTHQKGLKNLTERVRLTTGKEVITKKTSNTFLVKVPLIKITSA